MAKVRLENIRIVYPRFFVPNERNKYTVGILIEKNSPAYNAFFKAVGDAWTLGRDRHGAQNFPPNPSRAQVMNRAYCKEGGGLDSKGMPVPAYYDGCIGFTANSREPIKVLSKSGGRELSDGDPLIYDGQLASVILEVSPVYKEGNPCIGRYVSAVMIIGGGERLAIGSGGFVDARAEFADLIEPETVCDPLGMFGGGFDEEAPF